RTRGPIRTSQKNRTTARPSEASAARSARRRASIGGDSRGRRLEAVLDPAEQGLARRASKMGGGRGPPRSAMRPRSHRRRDQGPTQATLSGLPNGTYFWRVQAQNKALVNGAFSAPVSFVVTGSAAGTPATPTVTGPAANARFHPYEDLTISWTSAAGAASYEL